MSDTHDTGLLDLELHAEVWLGREEIPLERLMELRTGSVLPLSHDPEGPVDLVVNGTRVASGRLVVLDGRFGFRVSAADDAALSDEQAQVAGTGDSPPLPPVPDEIDKPAGEATAEGANDDA